LLDGYPAETRADFFEAAQWREHTYEVLNSLDNAVGRLSDAETGQRRYLLTGEEAYLEPFRASSILHVWIRANAT
jgi:hypothetical protein